MAKVVFITDQAPARTGSGMEAAVYGLCGALRGAGFEVTCLLPFSGGGRGASAGDFPVEALAGADVGLPELRDRLAAWLRSRRPELVWILHTHRWAVFAPFRNEWPHVLYVMDASWEMEQLRRRSRSARGGLNGVRSLVRSVARVTALRHEERRAVRQSSERGIAAAYVASEAVEMVRRTGRAVVGCTLCYPDWEPIVRRDDPSNPFALLLGHLEGTHTRYGLRFFFDEVMPVWEGPGGPRAVVRVVGGGRLPSGFPHPSAGARLRWIGFVPDLDDEWARAAALLVPVPLRQGIRSRIVEAWARGVPVISHPSAAVGLPSMSAGENYLVAESGHEWVDAMRELENNPALGHRLVTGGRAAFEAEFSIEAGARRVGELASLAVERFRGACAGITAVPLQPVAGPRWSSQA